MARIRTIKPKFWDDEKLGKVSRDARLLFIGTWNFADDLGIIIADPVWIRSKVLPYDKLKNGEIEKWIKELLAFKFIIPLIHKNENFFIIRTFDRHQRINKPNNEDVFISDEKIKSILEQSRNNHGTITEQALNDIGAITGGIGEERKGIGEDKEGNRSDSDFSEKKIKVVVMPFNGSFEKIWDEWKDYRSSQHDFKYKGGGSEQAALHELVSLAYGKEDTAIAIIRQSMSKGWKGFFPIKNLENGTTKSNNGFSREGIQAAVNERIKNRQQT